MVVHRRPVFTATPGEPARIITIGGREIVVRRGLTAKIREVRRSEETQQKFVVAAGRSPHEASLRTAIGFRPKQTLGNSDRIRRSITDIAKARLRIHVEDTIGQERGSSPDT